MRRGNNVGFVFFRQRFSRQAAAKFVDAFIVGERAAYRHFGKHFHALDFEDFQLYAAIVEQQDVAWHHVSGQAFVVDTDFFFVAFAFTEVGVEQEFVTDIEENFAFFEGRYADFRALEVTQNSNMATQFGRDFADFVCT